MSETVVLYAPLRCPDCGGKGSIMDLCDKHREMRFIRAAKKVHNRHMIRFSEIAAANPFEDPQKLADRINGILNRDGRAEVGE